MANLLLFLLVQNSEGILLQRDKAIKLQLKVYLEHLLHHRPLRDPKLSLEVKSLLIQIMLSCDEPLTESVHVTVPEVEYMKASIISSGEYLKETLKLLHHLVEDCVNQSLFLDHNILDALEEKMEGEYVEVVAELISKLLDDGNLSNPPSGTNTESEIMTVVISDSEGIFM